MHPRLRLKLIKSTFPRPLPGPWPVLAAPVHVADTQAKARACSVLRAFTMRDGEPVHACDLTASQAHDVARWAR